MNLGRFFGLTEAGAKAAVVTMGHNVVYCAMMRRQGVAKCAAQVTLLKNADGQDDSLAKYEGLDDARKYLKTQSA